jgi:hypothetical protein
MFKRHPAPDEEFFHIKSERLRTFLYVIREGRRMIEAIADSKWMGWWILKFVVGGSASWLFATNWLR